jgi:hypothetical protein
MTQPRTFEKLPHHAAIFTRCVICLNHGVANMCPELLRRHIKWKPGRLLGSMLHVYPGGGTGHD